MGGLGDAGAFSFQSSKNLTSGEGGMVTTDDKDVRDRVYAFMNVGRAPGGARWEYPRLGWNYRPSEYLAALLIPRLGRLEEQTKIRNANATYLSTELKQIEGFTPRNGVLGSANTVIIYIAPSIIQRDSAECRGSKFLEALNAEGIPSSSGYGAPLSQEAGIAHAAQKYPRLIRTLPCPVAEQVCQESVWLFQNLLLGSHKDMDDIV